MALLFPDLEDEQEKDEEEEYDYDKMSEVEEMSRYYNKISEVELVTVTNSLCGEKMNFTLHPGQMCAVGEEGRIYCQEELTARQVVIQKLTSSEKD